MKIAIIEKRVGKEPTVSEIENNLAAIQSFVGGYFEVVGIGMPDGRCYLHCNEDGDALGLPKNFAFVDIGCYIIGDVFFAQTNADGELTSMSQRNIDYLISCFSKNGTVLKL